MPQRTANFRRQHREILESARQLQSLLPTQSIDTARANELLRCLSRLAGQLNVHLAMEDQALYPRLLQHPEPAVRAMTQRYQDEMGGLKQAFSEYIATWASSVQIEGTFAAFVRDTNNILSALSYRIDREDNELYAMLDVQDGA